MTGEERSRSTVQGVVAAACERWRDGSSIGWDELLAPDTVVLGPGADQIFLDRDGIVGLTVPFRMTRDPSTLVPTMGDIRVGLAPGGRSGWFWGFTQSPHDPTGSGAQLRGQRERLPR